jgi:hypothetical protein
MLVAFVVVVAAAPVSAQTPPRMLLDAKAGTQRALQESYCVSQVTAEGGVTGCADTIDVRPSRFLAVQRRELLTFRLRRGVIVREHPACHPSCEAAIALYRLDARGRKRFIRAGDLPATPTKFRAPRLAGRYELEVFIGRFEIDDGRSGGTSGSFGIRIR